MNQSSKLGLAAFAVIVIVLRGLLLTKSSTTNTTSVIPTRAQYTKINQPTEQTIQSDRYKNGEYSAEGHYVSPAGPEQVNVRVTLSDNIITDVTFEGKGINSNTKKYQGLFAANYKPQVVGKNIDEVKLDKVSGSSLAPKGFNDAINQIRQQAKI